MRPRSHTASPARCAAARYSGSPSVACALHHSSTAPAWVEGWEHSGCAGGAAACSAACMQRAHAAGQASGAEPAAPGCLQACGPHLWRRGTSAPAALGRARAPSAWDSGRRGLQEAGAGGLGRMHGVLLELNSSCPRSCGPSASRWPCSRRKATPIQPLAGRTWAPLGIALEAQHIAQRRRHISGRPRHRRHHLWHVQQRKQDAWRWREDGGRGGQRTWVSRRRVQADDTPGGRQCACIMRSSTAA